MNYAKIGLGLLCLVIPFTMAQANDDTNQITIGGVSYRIRTVDRKIVAIPGEAVVTLNRATVIRAPQCEEFYKSMKDLEQDGSFERCNPESPRYERNQCDMDKISIADARKGDLPPSSSQDWKISWSPQGFKSPTAQEVHQAVQAISAFLKVSPLSVVVDFHPKMANAPIQLILNPKSGSWSEKYKQIGMNPIQMKLSADGKYISTQGLDVACDLMMKQASLQWTAQAEARVGLNHELSGDTTWAIREKFSQAGDLPGESLLEKAAVAGSRMNVHIQDVTQNEVQPTEGIVIDLFRILFNPETLDLRSSDSQDAFDAQFFSDSVRLSGSWSASVQ